MAHASAFDFVMLVPRRPERERERYRYIYIYIYIYKSVNIYYAKRVKIYHYFYYYAKRVKILIGFQELQKSA